MFQGQRERDSALSWPSSSEELVREVSERVPFAPTILSGERLFLWRGLCSFRGAGSLGAAYQIPSGSFTLKKLECLKQAF